MFEKEAEDYLTKLLKRLKIRKEDLAENQPEIQSWEKMNFISLNVSNVSKAFQQGAEFGYNKANEWHYVKDELPKVSGRYWVYTGGEPFTLDFDTEVNAFGYWCAVLSGNLGVCDTVFETVEERKEDEVIAWKEIVLPELKE